MVWWVVVWVAKVVVEQFQLPHHTAHPPMHPHTGPNPFSKIYIIKHPLKGYQMEAHSCSCVAGVIVRHLSLDTNN